MKILRTGIIVVGCLLVLLAGATDSSSQKKQGKGKAKPLSTILPSDSAAICHRLPKVGESFVLTYYYTDSLGTALPKVGSGDPDIANDSQFVIASDIKFMKHKHVVGTTHLAGKDTNYISYEPNGDILTYNTHRAERGWERLPFGMPSGTKLISDSLGKKVNILGREVFENYTSSSEIIGWDTMEIAGDRMPVKAIIISTRVQYRKVTTPDVPEGDPYDVAVSYWYSPALGYVARMNLSQEGKFLNQKILRYHRLP